MFLLTLSTDMESLQKIIEGTKKVECREIKPYYMTRFRKVFDFTMGLQLPVASQPPKEVEFKVGVRKNAPSVTTICSLTVDGGREEWDSTPGEWVYVLRIQQVLTEK